MKNNLKQQIIDETANEILINKKTKKEQEYTIYDYFLIPTEISNQEKIPPKNSISELVFYNKKEALVKKIKNQQIDLDCRDNIGQTASWTPLYWGVKFRKIECVHLLLEHGANINVVINDLEECCGTVLDLAILRGDTEMEDLLRSYVEKQELNLNQTFTAIRTKLRGKAPAFNFNSYVNNKKINN